MVCLHAFFLIHFDSLKTDGSDPASYSGKIVECSFNTEEQVWVSMRVRTDKNTPNDIKTYRKVTHLSIIYFLFLSFLPVNILNIYIYTYFLLVYEKNQVLQSINDNITEDVLLNEIYEIIRLPMYADRIRSDSKAAQQHANAGRRR